MNQTSLPIAYSEYHNFATDMVKMAVYKYCDKCFSEAEVEDIAGDVVLKMCENGDKYNPDKGNAGQWVWTMAKNTVITAAKSKRARTGVIKDPGDNDLNIIADDNTSRPDWKVRESDYNRHLYESLPKGRARQFFFWILEGLDADEISKRSGLSKNVVYVTKSRVISDIKKVA